MKKPVLGLATEEDMRNYEEIMLNSEAMRNRKIPQKPAANKGYKWQNIIRPMWNKYEKKTKEKAKRQQKKNKPKAFSQAIQTPCVNGWTF